MAIIVIQDREDQRQLEFHALKISKSLRSRNIKTLFYHLPSSTFLADDNSINTTTQDNSATAINANKKKSNLKYILGNVLKSNASHAILIGEEEFKKSEVTIKFLDSKIQKRVNVEGIVDAIKKD